jgi:hypothetical protein
MGRAIQWRRWERAIVKARAPIIHQTLGVVTMTLRTIVGEYHGSGVYLGLTVPPTGLGHGLRFRSGSDF